MYYGMLLLVITCTCPTTLNSYFTHFPMQQLSTLLQIPSRSDCPHESLFKIGLNSNTRQSSLETMDSHYYKNCIQETVYCIAVHHSLLVIHKLQQVPANGKTFINPH